MISFKSKLHKCVYFVSCSIKRVSDCCKQSKKLFFAQFLFIIEILFHFHENLQFAQSTFFDASI